MSELERWTDAELTAARAGVATSLARLADFTPASLHEGWRKCGKANCRCARPGERGHGPRHMLVRREEGRVKTRQVPAGLVAEYRERTGRWVEFQAACSRLAEINTELDRRRLLRGASAGRPAAGPEKGGSRSRPISTGSD